MPSQPDSKMIRSLNWKRWVQRRLSRPGPMPSRPDSKTIPATAVPRANARVVQIEIRQAAVERKFLGMFENVADATNCVNQRSRGVMIHFAAQTINVNIDDVGCGVNPHLPDMVQNHGPGHDSTFVAAKIFQ